MTGWNMPPGCTGNEPFFDANALCETCGREADACICLECPVCHEAGNPYCYEHGHLTYTYDQEIGRARLDVAKAKDNLQDAEFYLRWLEEHPGEVP